MRRIRKPIWSRSAGLVLGLIAVVCMGGLGFRAAHDWHLHGELGAGFFHLHFHVGDHEHGDHEHGDLHHPHHQPGSGRESPDGPEDRTHHPHVVLTINNAHQNLGPATPVVAPAGVSIERSVAVELFVFRGSNLDLVAQPRAPPA